MAQTPSGASGARTRRSLVETLLEEHLGDQPLPGLERPGPRATVDPTPAESAGDAAGGRGAGRAAPTRRAGSPARATSAARTTSASLPRTTSRTRPQRSGGAAAGMPATPGAPPDLTTPAAVAGPRPPAAAGPTEAAASAPAGGATGAAATTGTGQAVGSGHVPEAEALPAVQDVALGILSLMTEQAQRAGTVALVAGRGVLVRWVGLVRAVSPQVATARVDASIAALAQRGRRVRAEGRQAVTQSINAAFLSTVTSDAARELTVAAVEQATDDVIAVVLPAMLQAMREEHTEAALDEMMAGLLVRQLPAAMEKTLPALLMRTAARPTQFVPFLGGVLPRL